MNTLGCEYDNFLPTFRITNFANWHSNISTWKLTRLFSSDAHWHDLRRIWGISVYVRIRCCEIKRTKKFGKNPKVRFALKYFLSSFADCLDGATKSINLWIKKNFQLQKIAIQSLSFSLRGAYRKAMKEFIRGNKSADGAKINRNIPLNGISIAVEFRGWRNKKTEFLIRDEPRNWRRLSGKAATL